jgi:hypothetical protein
MSPNNPFITILSDERRSLDEMTCALEPVWGRSTSEALHKYRVNGIIVEQVSPWQTMLRIAENQVFCPCEIESQEVDTSGLSEKCLALSPETALFAWCRPSYSSNYHTLRGGRVRNAPDVLRGEALLSLTSASISCQQLHYRLLLANDCTEQRCLPIIILYRSVSPFLYQ